MAVVLQPRYPLPDRSKQTPLLAKDEDGVIDIGWCDGVLADGRPFASPSLQARISITNL